MRFISRTITTWLLLFITLYKGYQFIIDPTQGIPNATAILLKSSYIIRFIDQDSRNCFTHEVKNGSLTTIKRSKILINSRDGGVEYQLATLNLTNTALIKAIASDGSCVLVYDTYQKASMKLYFLNKTNSSLSIQKYQQLVDILANHLINQSDISKKFQVDQYCRTFKMDNKIYLYGYSSTQKYLLAFDNPNTAYFGSYVIDQNNTLRLYGYNMFLQQNKIQKNYSNFYKNKQIMSLNYGQLIVVISWQNSTTDPINIKNYKVQILRNVYQISYQITNSNFPSIKLIQGKFYEQTDKNGLIIKELPKRYFTISGRISSNQTFFKAFRINVSGQLYSYVYQINQLSSKEQLGFPSLITNSKSSDLFLAYGSKFIYARNTNHEDIDMGLTHGLFYLKGEEIIKLFTKPLPVQDMKNWNASILVSVYSLPRIFNIFIDQAEIIKIQRSIYRPDNQLILYEKQWNESINTDYKYVPYIKYPVVSRWSSLPNFRQFNYMSLNAKTFAPILVSITLPKGYYSNGYNFFSPQRKCSLIIDSFSSKVGACNLDQTQSRKITLQDCRSVNYSFFGQMYWSNNIVLADDCNHFKVNDTFYLWNEYLNRYEIDNSQTQWKKQYHEQKLNSEFNDGTEEQLLFQSWTYLNNSINMISQPDRNNSSDYNKYLRKCNITISTIINGINYTIKQINLNNQNFYNRLKVTLNANAKLDLIHICDSKGYGINCSIISINYQNKSLSNITIPEHIAQTLTPFPQMNSLSTEFGTYPGSLNNIQLRDNFFYVGQRRLFNNTNTSYSEHKIYGYLVVGNRAIQIFNRSVQFQIYSGYYKNIWILDTDSNSAQVAVAHLYVKREIWVMKKMYYPGISNIINPFSLSSCQMSFTYNSSALLLRQQFQQFGKWVYIQSGLILYYIQYNSSIPIIKSTNITKKLSITKTSKLLAVSPQNDCILTFIEGYSLDIISINTTSKSITKKDVYSLVKRDLLSDYGILNSYELKEIKVGSKCWAFKLSRYVYIKNQSTSQFVRFDFWPYFPNPSYDSSLKFVTIRSRSNFGYWDQFHNFTQYMQHVSRGLGFFCSLTNAKQNKDIIVSKDQKKALVLSYEQYQDLNQTHILDNRTRPKYYVCVIKTCYNSPMSLYWSSFSFNMTINRLVEVPKIIHSPNLQTIGIYVRNITSHFSIKSSVSFYKILYETNQFKPYNTSGIFFDDEFYQDFIISQNYLYCLKSHAYKQDTIMQYFYKFDEVNMKIIEIAHNPISRKFAESIKRVKLLQENGTVFAIFQIQQVLGAVKLFKKAIGKDGVQTRNYSMWHFQTGMLFANNQITLCTSGCSLCVDQYSCINCLNGFIVDSNYVCIKCAPQCKTCLPSALDICKSCFNGNYLVQGKCFKCHEQCLTCEGPYIRNCTSCRSGFYLSNQVQGFCDSCIDNCVFCRALSFTNQARCEICRMGYVYNSQLRKCIKCIAGCSNCRPDRIYQCASCTKGYDPEYDNNKTLTKCIKCPAYCDICRKGQCSICNQGYRLFQNQCLQKCQPPCLQCSATNTSICTSCLPGYTLNQTLCIDLIQCNRTQTCYGCPIGFHLIDKFCYRCEGGDHCLSCENTDFTKCAICKKGFFLNQTHQCQQCKDEGCRYCQSENTCLQCKDGYTLAVAGIASSCVKCDESCAKCSLSPMNCEECSPGYTLRGWKCVTTENIRFEIVKRGNLSQFSSYSYDDMQQQIFSQTPVLPQAVNIEQIRQGSIYIMGTIDTKDINQRPTLIIKLIQAVSNYRSTVLSASFTEQTFAIDNWRQIMVRNIVITVSIILSVAIIGVIIMLFMLYRQGIICKTKTQPVHLESSMEPVVVQESSVQKI